MATPCRHTHHLLYGWSVATTSRSTCCWAMSWCRVCTATSLRHSSWSSGPGLRLGCGWIAARA